MSFRATEITVREVLLEELGARHVRFGHELSFPLPTGRKAPDAVLANGANYVLETKLGGEADYFEDIKKLTEWIKLRTAPISGAFAVLLPDGLRRVPWESIPELARSPEMKYEVAALFRDERPGDRKTGTLAEVTNWIAEQVLRPPREVEPDTGFVVRVLAGAVTQLSHQMRGLSLKHFEDIFGGRLVFDNILEVKAGHIPVSDMRRAASYLLINQIIFYHVLSRADQWAYPPIDSERIATPSDLTTYFRKVLEIDYAPTFGFDVASRLPKRASETVRSVVEVVRAMGLARIRQDILGKVFHNLIPLPIRKPLAAYYTNTQAAELLAALSVRSQKDAVLDPACGSGTLLVACYQRKRELIEGGGHLFSQTDHERFLQEEIMGIDIMPFAAHLAVIHLSLQAPKFTTERIRVAVWDSTELAPGKSIPSLTRELSQAFRRATLDMFAGGDPQSHVKYVEKGALTPGGIGGEEIRLEPVDIVIMNPPFTSSDHLGAEYKRTLKERFGEEYEGFLQGKISFQGHFLLLADKFLKPGGRVAAVLPQTTLTGEAFGPILRKLREDYTLRAIVVGLGRSAFSENTALSEILLVAEKRAPPQGHRFAVLGTKKSPADWDSDDLDNLVLRLQTQQDLEDDLAVLRWIPQEEFSVEQGDFTKVLSGLSKGYGELLENLHPILNGRLMVAYNEYEKKTGAKAFMSALGNREVPGPEGRGGVFFGASALNVCRDKKRAIKRVDRLILVKEDAMTLRAKDRVSGSEFEIPRSAVVPTVRRLSFYRRFDISGDTDILVAKAYSGLQEIFRTIYGSAKAEQFVARIKKRWPRRIKQGSTSLCLARRIDPAAPGTYHFALYTKYPSFTGHGGWGFRGISDEDAKLLCLWFNSSLFLFQVAETRTQTRGTWWRLDKHRFANTRIPDLSSLTQSQRKFLLQLFENLHSVEFPSLLEQLKISFEGRRTLDAAWFSVLGIPESQREGRVLALHKYLYETLNALLLAMGKD